MRRLLTGYAVVFNLRHGRSGHLFQNRYKSIVCEEDSFLLELVRYIHLNPLRVALAESLDDLDSYKSSEWSFFLFLTSVRTGKTSPEKLVPQKKCLFTLKGLSQVIAAAASHHRLAWIHPFLDGNGRVTRLMTHAYLKKAKIDGHGLWTVSRGFARNREEYLASLAGADQPRRGDLDGRGNLTQAGLLRFCTFFLKTAVDQIDFMSGLLGLDGMQKRIQAVVNRQVSFGALKPEAGHLRRDVFLRGEIPRGEIPSIIGMPERSARRVVSSLLEKSYLVSDSEKGPVMLGFPASMVGYYFPRLYPEGVEASLD